MAIHVQQKSNQLNVSVNLRRIDGNNEIFRALVDDSSLDLDVELIEFDMDKVEYMNSLGIAEFISLHRYFVDLNNGKTRFAFTNLDPKIYTLMNLVEIGKLADLHKK